MEVDVQCQRRLLVIAMFVNNINSYWIEYKLVEHHRARYLYGIQYQQFINE